jgi:hypothetical protein
MCRPGQPVPKTFHRYLQFFHKKTCGITTFHKTDPLDFDDPYKRVTLHLKRQHTNFVALDIHNLGQDPIAL